MPSSTDGAPRVPRATYRLQFNHAFRFDDARGLVDYLDALGISDLYASPYLAARAGTVHGYDLVDHNALNPEIGSPAEYDRLAAALRDRGMGQILDVVPNHMGIIGGANRWWNDVLEHGPRSPYAEFFDIDWDPLKRELAGKVLLPILGDQYGRILENQELVLEMEDHTFWLRYHETRLPLAPRSIALILRHRGEALAATLGESDPVFQEYLSIIAALTDAPARTESAPDGDRGRIGEHDLIRRRLVGLLEASAPVRESLEETVRLFNGKRGDPRSFDLLDRLLDEQAYRLAHWRVAAEEINYRRFFDVNDLAAIRMENPLVFAETHRLIFDLVETGKVSGLRIDHPDGLFDPAGYFLTLQRESGPVYLIAEKILARGERLPTRWAIHGTTGYEFLNLASGIFVDAANARALDRAYAAFTGQRTSWSDIVYQAKQLIMAVSMSSELAVLGRALSRLAARHRHSRDFTLASLTHALREVVACFPVYRTYITAGDPEVALQDRACVEVAVAFAKRRNPATSTSIFDFVKDTLLLRDPEGADDAYRRDQGAFVQKFQQLTAPVMAKGVEDTAFYRYHRLLSLNEVGGDPDRFGVSVEEFHAQCRARQEQWPNGLSATATHDTKRGEDVRARIHVLSEMPREWRAAVNRWHRWNTRHLGRADDRRAPDRNDEYFLYQTLVGAWPGGALTPDGMATFASRLQAYALKAIREAKVHTSWVNPNVGYEEATQGFLAAILSPGPRNRFLADLAQFQRPMAALGMVNSLAQTLIKITAPGVPDFYRGTELWDLSLVDPDNRRPIDFGLRQTLLAGLRERIAAGDLPALTRTLVAHWEDGRIKLYTIHRALACRRARTELFRRGDYVPLATGGRHAPHVCAYARQRDGEAAVVIVPRLTARLTGNGARLPLGRETWDDTSVAVPPELADARLTNVYTGAIVPAGALMVAEVFGSFPVALLAPAGPAGDPAPGTEGTSRG
jgi:(1->4)-alpha-D-glucan 1-alpha-D-glucosylmutase